jgi:hypothetical protein
MSKEFLKMQKLAGLITESQYNEKVNEAELTPEKAVQQAISLAPKIENSPEFDDLAQKVANDPKLISQLEKALQKGGITLSENEGDLDAQDMKAIALNFAKKSDQDIQEGEEVTWDDAAAGTYMSSFVLGGVATGLSPLLYKALLAAFPLTTFLVGGPAIIGAITGVALVALARKVYKMYKNSKDQKAQNATVAAGGPPKNYGNLQIDKAGPLYIKDMGQEKALKWAKGELAKKTSNYDKRYWSRLVRKIENPNEFVDSYELNLES